MALNNQRSWVVSRKQSEEFNKEALFDAEFDQKYNQPIKSKSDVWLDKFIQELQKSPQLFFRIDQKSNEVRMFSSSINTGNEKESQWDGGNFVDDWE